MKLKLLLIATPLFLMACQAETPVVKQAGNQVQEQPEQHAPPPISQANPQSSASKANVMQQTAKVNEPVAAAQSDQGETAVEAVIKVNKVKKDNVVDKAEADKVTMIAEIKPQTVVVATGDAVKGKKLTKKCQACHTFTKGGKNKVGPNLFGVLGRKQGSKEGFRYGSYLSSVDGIWDETKLRAWIANSQAVAKAAGKKAKMPTQRITGQKADDVIAYLKTLK